jgi:dTDP-4-amino-4,6-dideoxygalactose transaminase
MLTLPLNPSMSDEDVSDVIDAVLDVVTVFRR